MKTIIVVSFMFFGVVMASYIALAGTQGMPSLPILQPTKTFIVKDGDELDAQKGFGEDESMTRMMNLMMVEGSGYEGMDMDAMKLADNNSHSGHSMEGMSHAASADSVKKPDGYTVEITSKTKVKIGSNAVEFVVKEKSKPVKGLKIKSQVYMTSMDMGTEEPKVKEVSPGKYQVKAPFTMKGPWAIKLLFPNGKEQVLNFDVN